MQDSVGFLVTGATGTSATSISLAPVIRGVYVTGQHNTFENCTFHDNRNTGLEINEGGAHTTVINSDAYRNYDPKKFGGIGGRVRAEATRSPGNRFIGCRAWENSDDRFDAFDSPETVTFERCSAFRNGVDVWQYGGFDGNGNGFKVGGNMAQANHQLSFCTAFENVVKGFDQNNNSGGITIYNSTAYKNGTNFGMGNPVNSGQEHDFKNNVSLGASNSIANASQQNNSWNEGFSVSEADFSSLDTALGSAPRAADGSLPVNDFLRLKGTSPLVDSGVDVGLPFNGSAPISARSRRRESRSELRRARAEARHERRFATRHVAIGAVPVDASTHEVARGARFAAAAVLLADARGPTRRAHRRPTGELLGAGFAAVAHELDEGPLLRALAEVNRPWVTAHRIARRKRVERRPAG